MNNIKRLFKYPEIGKLERELDNVIKFLNDNKVSLTQLEEMIKKIPQSGSGGGITIIGTKNPPVNADKFIFQDSAQSFEYVTITWQQLSSIFALASHQHTKSQITDLNEGLVGTKEVDETNIANNKILIYNSTSGKLEYKILNEGLVGSKEVDETNIANNKILVYNSTAGKLEYQNNSSGSPVVGNQTATEISISTTAVDIINKSASISVGDFLFCELYGRAYNNSGSSRTFRVRLDFGGSLLELIAPAALSTGNYTPIRVMFTISVISSSLTIVTGFWTQITALASGVSAATSGSIAQAWLNIAADRTGTQTIKIQMYSSGTGTQNFSGSAIIRKYGAA